MRKRESKKRCGVDEGPQQPVEQSENSKTKLKNKTLFDLSEHSVGRSKFQYIKSSLNSWLAFPL